jgi:hypothetical protein
MSSSKTQQIRDFGASIDRIGLLLMGVVLSGSTLHFEVIDKILGPYNLVSFSDFAEY